MKKQISIIFFFVGLLSFSQQKQWTLEECVNYAIENNISIQQSELNVKLAEIDKNQAIYNFLPNLSGSASYNINRGSNINPATNQFENETFKSASGGLSSGVNIFAGLQNWKNLQRAKLNKLASDYNLDKMKDDISLFVANSFLQILFNKEQLKVFQSQYEVNNKENLTEPRISRCRSLPEGDKLEVMATDASQQQQIIAAENALFISKLSLAQTLQIEDYRNFEVTDNFDYMISDDVLNNDAETIVEKAKEVVNDVKIAEANKELAEYDLKISKGALQPTLQVFTVMTQGLHIVTLAASRPDNPTRIIRSWELVKITPITELSLISYTCLTNLL
ncbi:MAG: TolC family protein [Flavobacteriaceae bacterium]